MTKTATPAMDPSERERARTRRRFVRRQWRRRWLNWKPLLAALVTVTLVVAGIWLVYFSSHLAVQQVGVSGNGFVSAGQIRTATDVPEGRPLARIDLDTIERRVEGIAAVKSATATRAWPDAIKIAVTERKAVAVVDLGDDIRGMDDQGVVFRKFDKRPVALPLVKTSGVTGGEALHEAALVLASLPTPLQGRVAHLSVVTVDQIWLVLRDQRVIMWGSAEESEQKAQVLTVLLKRPAKTYDVSVPGQPTTSDRLPATPLP